MIKNNNPDHSLVVQYVRHRLFCVFNVFYSFNYKTVTGKKKMNQSDSANFTKPTKTIMLNGRKKKVQSDPVRAPETHKFKCSTVLLSELNYSHFAWSRAVRKINEYEQAWVYYCYGNKLNFDYQITICKYIWLEFNNNLLKNNKKIRLSTVSLLRDLVFLAVQNAVFKIKNNSDFYDSKTLAFLTKKSISTWRGDYSSYWNQLLNICYSLDREALINVDRQYRS